MFLLRSYTFLLIPIAILIGFPVVVWYNPCKNQTTLEITPVNHKKNSLFLTLLQSVCFDPSLVLTNLRHWLSPLTVARSQSKGFCLARPQHRLHWRIYRLPPLPPTSKTRWFDVLMGFDWKWGVWCIPNPDFCVVQPCRGLFFPEKHDCRSKSCILLFFNVF